MSAAFTLLVDGEQQPPTSFALPEMSLSSARSQMTKRIFVLLLEAGNVVEHLKPAYEAWVVESKRDDELCGVPQDALAAADYPSLGQLLASPPLLELVVGHYLFRDLFDPQTLEGRDPIDYWFDQVTSCTSDGNLIKITGVCYSKS